jgi:hypothetical protein
MNMIFVNNVVGAAAAFVLYETFTARFDLPGVAWAFAILQLLMLIVSSVTARRATGVPFPAASFALSAAAVAAGATGALVFDGSSLTSVGLKALACAAFLPAAVAARLVSTADLRDLAALLLPGRWAPRGPAAA